MIRVEVGRIEFRMPIKGKQIIVDVFPGEAHSGLC